MKGVLVTSAEKIKTSPSVMELPLPDLQVHQEDYRHGCVYLFITLEVTVKCWKADKSPTTT